MGRVTGKAGEGAVEVAGGAADPTRELFYHVKVVLLHLIIWMLESLMRGIKTISYFAVGAGNYLPLLHDEDILARL